MAAEDSQQLWSAPDVLGIVCRHLDVGAVTTARGKRRRRALNRREADIELWLPAQKQLLRDWLKGKNAVRRWTALLKLAGSDRFTTANALVQDLLATGWIEVEEQRRRGVWELTQIEFFALEELRERLGLKNRDKLAIKHQQLSSSAEYSDPQLARLSQDLGTMPAERAIQRHQLLQALEQWQGQQLFGTRRDFSQFARGNTKALSSSEWQWLSDGLDLEEWNIGRHTATLYLRAPIRLQLPDGELNLKVVPDFIVLTPETIASVAAIKGRVQRWQVVENQTCFEKLARQSGEGDAVLWVPGQPPSWWQTAVAHLLTLCPAPAQIACDPDPAGIRIALTVGQLWQACGIDWAPWKMTADDLARLKHPLPLSDKDKALLEGLIANDQLIPFFFLASAMLRLGIKGEQEELFL